MKPLIIKNLENELIDVLNQDNSPSISVEVAAKLIGQDRDCLRRSIANGTCPFGYGGINREKGTHFGRVSKLALWNFLTKGVIDES